MKNFILSVMTLGMVLSVSAQSKLDLQSRMSLRQLKMEQAPAGFNAKTKSVQMRTAPANRVNGFITLADGTTAEQLEAEGITVVRTRGNIALVSMPINSVEKVARLNCVKKLQLERKVYAKTDNARSSMGVNQIHTGEGLPQAYTGKGVVTGIVDQGMDPNHINFRNEDGTSRIKEFSYIYLPSTATSANDVQIYEYTAENIDQFTTDDQTTYHGTHTMGIMAGSFRGDLSYGTLDGSTPKVVTAANPYYGMANESDIVGVGATLSDYTIALGCEQILDYAYTNNQPAIINLSLGSNYGAHDGTQAICKYFEAAGEEAIICIAAGNEGDLPIAKTETFTAEDTELKTFIYPQYPVVNASNGTFYNLRYGQVYIYSKDATEFDLDIMVYSTSTGRTTVTKTMEGNTNGSAVYLSSPSYAEDGDITHINFTKAFDGYVGWGSDIDSDNGRFYALIDFFMQDNQTYNSDGKYILGFAVKGKDGQRVDVFCDGSYTYFSGYGQAGWEDGSCNGTISDMACGGNVLVVGSYNTKQYWVSLDGKGYGYPYDSFTDGKISSFSSYGTLVDGRNLPHICAPGSAVISSISTPYCEYYQSSLTDAAVQGKMTEESGRVNYWAQSIGTSMATPAVTGAIATWLEADPTLTFDEVKEIAELTAVKDSYVTEFTGDPVQWGAGKFDAYAGLKEVLRRANNSSAIQDISVKADRLLVTAAGMNSYNIFLGGADKLDVTIFNLQGQPVLKQNVTGDETNIDASALSAGVYVLNVNGVHSQRILVK